MSSGSIRLNILLIWKMWDEYMNVLVLSRHFPVWNRFKCSFGYTYIMLLKLHPIVVLNELCIRIRVSVLNRTPVVIFAIRTKVRSFLSPHLWAFHSGWLVLYHLVAGGWMPCKCVGQVQILIRVLLYITGVKSGSCRVSNWCVSYYLCGYLLRVIMDQCWNHEDALAIFHPF